MDYVLKTEVDLFMTLTSRMRFLGSALLLLRVAALAQTKEPPPDALFLSRATSHIAEAIGALRNYTCL
jgi:hypothetical protein